MATAGFHFAFGAAVRNLSRHRALLVAAGLVLVVFVIAPGIGFVSRLNGAHAANPLALTPTQLASLRETGLLMVGVAVVTGLIGVTAAWLVSIYDFPFRRLLDIGLVLPLAFPTYLAAYVAVDLLDYFGPIQTMLRWLAGSNRSATFWFPDIHSFGGAVFVLGLVLFPYVYVPCRILFSQTARNIVDAGRLLGATPVRLFFRVGLPLARPAILSGVILALLETLNDIGAVEYLGVASLSAVIRDLWLNRFDLAGAARLAAMLVVIVYALLLIDPTARQGETARHANRSAATPRRTALAPLAAACTLAFCALPVLLGFVFPALHLLYLALHGIGLGASSGELFAALASTLGLAISTGMVVMFAGSTIAIAIRISGKFARTGTLAMLGYATPGTVLVLAILPVLTFFDDALAAFALPALFTGSSIAIVYALSVRFLGLGAVQASLALARLPLNVDAVARIHGLGDLKLAWQIHRPAIHPGLKLGAILVFIDTVKELPATLLLRPLNFETLATRAYSRAAAGLFEQGAMESLLIVAISALAAVLLGQRNRA
ncbi:ThiP ABC-type Fe3+ transport system, permease component [Rhabdaerophilaceae bacterium]